jgi:uncharacterized BrkB/YihY/UPF0761 family membrane protein
MTTTPQPPEPKYPPPSTVPTRRERLRARADQARDWAETNQQRIEAMRPEHATVEIGFRMIDHDIRIAGGVLGGGLAYRLFFFGLALAVLTAGGLGFGASSGSNLEAAAHDVGLTDTVSQSVADAAENAQSGRWWLLLTGLVLVAWSSRGLFRALRLVHAAAWRTSVPPSNIVRGTGAVVAVTGAAFVFLAAIGRARAEFGILAGFVATALITAAFVALWIWVSASLPSQPVPWTAFVPGAVLLTVGFQLLNIGTALFLADRLASSSALYGALGVAATVLFYLYLVGRLVVWAAELNAVTWWYSHPAEADKLGDGPARLPGS